jgi:hypothetical protein
MHLLALLLWLDVLVLSLPQAKLMDGLLALMRPLAAFRIDTDRIALRLALTLKVIELLETGDKPNGQGPARVRGRSVFDWLTRSVDPMEIPEHVELHRTLYRPQDYLVAWLCLTAAAAWSVYRIAGHG